MSNLADEIRAYNLWANTFDTNPDNFVAWRQRDNLWRDVRALLDGGLDDVEIGEGLRYAWQLYAES